MRAHLRNRARAQSITTVAPTPEDANYSPDLAKAAASILYRSPISSKAGHPIYILNAAALPDVKEVEYNSLLPYVIARLPGEDELVGGAEYEVIFFAGSGAEGSASSKRSRPGWGWLIQAYHVLSRAMRKRIQKLYIVHEKTWVRVITEMFSSVVSPKFRRKIVHAGTLTQLALYLPIEDLLIPPSAYLQDRKLTADIHSPYVTGKRAFSARNSLPVNFEGKRRLPRVIRETTSFVLMEKVIDTEGIFRISAPAKLKEVLREAYDRGQKFIVWKDHESCLPLPKYTNAMESDAILEEIDSTETYGPHIAAGLIKLWYSELREPMVPQPAYKELVRLHGDAHITPSLDQLVDLISPQSEWSPLPAISRELLVRHLLPVLSAVASHEDNNKMTPDNLAVCFAPTFVCGPDQMEDVKISAIIRRLLAVLVTMWPQLLEKCDVDPKALWEDLRAPSNIDDYEDPLEENRITPPAVGPVDIETQQSGIILNDNNIQEPVEVPSSDTKSQLPDPSQLPPRTAQMELTLNTNPPPLPPRSGNEWPTAPGSDNDPGIRRKPTPTQGMPPQGIAIQGMPPRYSTVFGGEASGSPSSYIGPVDGFGPPRRGDWSLHASDNELNAAKILNNDSTDSLFAKPSPLQTVAPNSFVPNVVVPIVVASNVVPPNVVVPIPVVKRKPVASSENVKEGSGSGPAIERPKES